MRAAMTLSNELADRLHADRAAIGWIRKGYVRLRAISHMERFEPKMAAVQSLETVMEEAFEQNAEILWPAPEGDAFITRDHGQFAAAEGSGHILSAPLRFGGACIGVATVERRARPFTADEVAWLRLCLDQAARLLNDLEAREGWFGARAWRGMRGLAARALGVEHTGAKLLALAGAAALLFLVFGRWPYRVEAPFTLRTDHAAVLPAPFDGYIEEVAVDKGDEVRAGDLLLSLDVGDLLLEEAAVLADLTRFHREVEKARAEDALAEMRMAAAQVEQASARLELVRRRIARSQLRAPFDGIVVEGDLKERVGSSVRQGDPLMKVARPDTLYAELRAGETGIAQVRSGATARLAFAGRPGDPFPMQVVHVAPMAQLHEGANVFIVRCRRDEGPEDWWRPGMSGVARIEAGQRSPVWILTHRTTDFLRLKFGW